MAVTGEVRARTIVGNWKDRVAEKNDLCRMRRTGAMRREHSQRESYFIREIGANMTFGLIQCIVKSYLLIKGESETLTTDFSIELLILVILPEIR